MSIGSNDFVNAPDMPEGNRGLTALPSYRIDWTDTQFATELNRIRQATAIEREWFNAVPHQVFDDDAAIEAAFSQGSLVAIAPRQGLFPIWRLLDWSNERSDSAHPFNYSPPYARPEVSGLLDLVADAWYSQQDTLDDGSYYLLPVTSLVRSTQYQAALTASDGRKIAIDPATDGISSHQYGFAVDIDASGVYRYIPGTDSVVPINPHQPGYAEAEPRIIKGRNDLRTILDGLSAEQVVNYCEEVPETKEWCFHICVNPTIPTSEILQKLTNQGVLL